jgi:hypothetical protein
MTWGITSSNGTCNGKPKIMGNRIVRIGMDKNRLDG